MTARQTVVLVLVCVLLGLLVGQHATRWATTTPPVVFEDGSYPAGCLAGHPCEEN